MSTSLALSSKRGGPRAQPPHISELMLEKESGRCPVWPGEDFGDRNSGGEFVLLESLACIVHGPTSVPIYLTNVINSYPCT